MGEQPSRTADRPSPFTPRRIAALALAGLAILFILQNGGETTLRLFGVSFAAPLWLFTLALLGLGVIIGALLSRRSSSD